MKKGSVTIFSMLSMMLVVSALFAMLEAARFHEINHLAQLQTQIALESIFAEYNTHLWEEYHLLACKQSDLVTDMQDYGNSRILGWDDGTNFFQFRVEDVSVKGYTRLTDGNGRAFVQAVSGYMEENLLYETAQELYNQYESMKTILGDSEFDFLDIQDALEQLEEGQSSSGSTGSETSEEDSPYAEEDYQGEKNPLLIIQNLQEAGILSLVVKDSKDLSNQQVDIFELVSYRELPEDFHSNIEALDWYDRVLLQQYLLTYMSNYTDEKGHALGYELEYLIGGKSTDIANMKVVVTQLLGLRAASNFLYLLSSPTKVEQARLLAIAIAGASLSPAIIGIVKNAVLIAWAFAESILDIRTLLDGGKIALMKSNSSWTLGLDFITTIGEGYSKAKESMYGLDYEGYLGILLLLQEESVLAKRSMDMQEATLRKLYSSQDICMEDWITYADLEVSYKYKPVFFSIESVLPLWEYKVIVKKEFGY